MGYRRPETEPHSTATDILEEPSLCARGKQFLAALRAIDSGCPFPRAKLSPEILPPDLLPRVCLFDWHQTGDFRCRLFGTGLTAQYGADLTGRSLAEIWTGEPLDRTLAIYTEALSKPQPTLTSTACTVAKGRIRYERVLMPLVDKEGATRFLLVFIDLQEYPEPKTVIESLKDDGLAGRPLP